MISRLQQNFLIWERNDQASKKNFWGTTQKETLFCLKPLSYYVIAYQLLWRHLIENGSKVWTCLLSFNPLLHFQANPHSPFHGYSICKFHIMKPNNLQEGHGRDTSGLQRRDFELKWILIRKWGDSPKMSRQIWKETSRG